MNLKKIVSIGLCFFIIVSILPISFARAAGVAVTLGTTTPIAVNTAYNSTILFTPSTSIPSGGKIYFYYTQLTNQYDDTGFVTGDITTANATTTTVDTANNIVTFTATGTINTLVTITIANSHFKTPSVAGNYSLAITTDNNLGGGDQGAVVQYVGSTNEVLVTALILPTLSFTIRNTADNAEQATVGGQKTCSLGTLTTSAAFTCDYRLKVATNSYSGYSISYISNTAMTNGSYSLTDAIVGTPGSTPGTFGVDEQYGIILTEGSNSPSGSVTRDTDFAGTSTNVFKITKTTGPNLMLHTTTPNNPTTTSHSSLVQHRATIIPTTRAGLYSHTVTYTVAASF